MKLPGLFQEYVERRIINKVSPDKSIARFLIEESEKSLKGLNQRVKIMGIDENNANSIVKDCYDIVMELIRAKMLLNGYKSSGQYAHEAEISFLRNLEFPDNEISFLNELRYFRNGITYYGKILDKEYAEKVFKFVIKIYPKLEKVVQNEL